MPSAGTSMGLDDVYTALGSIIKSTWALKVKCGTKVNASMWSVFSRDKRELLKKGLVKKKEVKGTRG